MNPENGTIYNPVCLQNTCVKITENDTNTYVKTNAKIATIQTRILQETDVKYVIDITPTFPITQTLKSGLYNSLCLQETCAKITESDLNIYVKINAKIGSIHYTTQYYNLLLLLLPPSIITRYFCRKQEVKISER